MENRDLKSLAWLFLQMKSHLSQMPYCIEDVIQEPPDWYLADPEDEDESPVWTMMTEAEMAARKLLEE